MPAKTTKSKKRTPTAAQIKAREERISAAQEMLEEQVAALADGDEWKRYLDSIAAMPRFSANNNLMILSQRPDATRVAGFNQWKAMGRHVRRGEKGIGIWVPTRARKAEAKEQDNAIVEEPAGERTEKADEQVEKKARPISGFALVSVFDVSQTDGEPLPAPPRPKLLDGDVPAGLWDALEAHAVENGFAVTVEDLPPLSGGERPNGFTSFSDKRIVVGEHCPPQQAVKTLAHELAHMEMHGDGAGGPMHTGLREVEAESVAYTTMRAAGIDSIEYTAPYVNGWAGGDVEKLRAVADRVHDTSKKLIDGIYVRVPELNPEWVAEEARLLHEERVAEQEPSAQEAPTVAV